MSIETSIRHDGVPKVLFSLGRQYFHWLALLATCLSSGVLLGMRAFLYLPLSVGLLLGTVCYLLVCDPGAGTKAVTTYGIGSRVRAVNPKVYLVAYTSCLATSALLLVNSGTPPRPLFYLLLALVAATLFASVVNTGETVTALLLGVTALWLFSWPQLVFPNGFGGPDAYYHISQMVVPITETHFIPSDTLYSYYPGHQVFVAITSIVLDTSPRMTYYVLPTVVLAGSTLIVYSFVRFLTTKSAFAPSHTPELAAIVFMSSSFVLRYAFQGNHLLYGGVFLLVLVSLFSRIFLGGSTDNRTYALVLVVYVALVVTHHYTAAICLFLLATFALFSRVKRAKWLLMAMGVVTLLHWVWIAEIGGVKKIVTNIVPLFLGFGVAAPPEGSVNQPAAVLLTTTAGTGILLLFTQLGLIAGVRSEDKPVLIVAVLCYTFLSIIGVGVLIGAESLSPHRILFFSQLLFFPFFAALSAFLIAGEGELTAGFTIILLVSLLTVTSPAAAADTALYGDRAAHSKNYETPNEVEAIRWYDTYGDSRDLYVSRSFVDFQSGTVMFRPDNEESAVGAEPIPVSDDAYTMTDTAGETIILYSEHDRITGYRPGMEASRRLGQAEHTRVNEESVQRLEENHRVFDNGIVHGFA